MPPLPPHPHGAPWTPEGSRPGPGERLNRALEAEGLYAFPPALAAQIVAEALGGRGRRLWERGLWAAAAVIVAVSAWGALAGGLPAPPGGPTLTSWAQPPVALPAERALEAAPSVAGSAAPALAALALALLALSPVLARRLLAPRASTGAGGAA